MTENEHGNPVPKICNVNTMSKCMASLTKITAAVTESACDKAAAIERYADLFEARVHFEPIRLCGNDEYLHPTDITELLSIAALCETMGSVLKNAYNGDDTDRLKQKLDEISLMATDVVFSNIPYKEIEAANATHSILLRASSDRLTF